MICLLFGTSLTKYRMIKWLLMSMSVLQHRYVLSFLLFRVAISHLMFIFFYSNGRYSHRWYLWPSFRVFLTFTRNEMTARIDFGMCFVHMFKHSIEMKGFSNLNAGFQIKNWTQPFKSIQNLSVTENFHNHHTFAHDACVTLVEIED